jgi:hypothetical protein
VFIFSFFTSFFSFQLASAERKVKKINEIWDDKAGVVSLHVFHSQLHNEALTREAVMIDALGKFCQSSINHSTKHFF